MNFFGKLFESKSKTQSPQASALSPPPSDPAKDPNMIRIFDSYGREMFITKQAWRDEVLLGNIKKAWNTPDELYNMIISALDDGFRSDVIRAAQHLYDIDPNRVRAVCIWGIILMEENRLDEAEKVFRHHLEKYGKSGVIFTNLAKIYSKRNKAKKSLEILWQGLEIDPNQVNGMEWYEAVHRERDGETAGIEALQRLAQIPRSWRAQLWLARSALKKGHLEEALFCYNQSLHRCGAPVPRDLLMQMSGDLGQFGYLPELLNLVEPLFDVQMHGIEVGNNLIKAHIDLGQIESARKIIDQLYALKRPDWKQTLNFWDTEIAKVHVATESIDTNKPLKIAMLLFEGPIWLKPTSLAAELFPNKSLNSLIISFLGCCIKTGKSGEGVYQMPDNAGRMSRSVPLFLAEQVAFRSDTRVQTLIPWMMNKTGGFVVCGAPWSDDDAANYARQCEAKSDYVVTICINATSEPWKIEINLIRSIDDKRLGALEISFQSTNPENALCTLADKLLMLLAEQAEVEFQPVPSLYKLPDTKELPNYLLRLEQLLAVRCGAMDKINPGFLNGEREIVDGNLQLCLTFPKNIPTRILLAQTLLAMRKLRPDVIEEFKDKIELLQKEKPLQEPAQSLLQRILNEAVAA